MKKVLIIFCALFLVACSSSDESPSSITELQIGNNDNDVSLRQKNSIAKEGEVDVYHVNVVEANRVIQFHCTGPIKAKVDLLVHVYALDGNGNLHMIAGNHAKDNSIDAADVKVNVFVDTPKELYVHVRDLLDDDWSDSEDYYLTADYVSISDDNNTFQSAERLTLNDQGVSNEARETIGNEGDEDFFTFTIEAEGVYDFHIDYNASSDNTVELSVEIFDSNGTSLENGARLMGFSREAHILHSLAPGDYTVVVKDEGENDYELSEFYTVDVSMLDVNEVSQNDTIADASDTIPAEPAIAYYSDKDWYKVNYADGGNLNILDFSFSSEARIRYQVNIYQAASTDEEPPIENALFSRDFDGGLGNTLNAILKLNPPAEGQDYYLVVKAQNGANVTQVCPYTSALTIQSVIDADEDSYGDNTDQNPLDLSGEASHTGMISYQSDVDWYEVTLPLANEDRVLSFFLDIPESPLVEYALDIKRTDDAHPMTKHIFHGSRDQRATDLNTSFIVPAQGSGTVTYFIKVSDLQGDDGENRDELGQNKTYTLRWSVAGIPDADSVTTFPAGSTITSSTYNDEKNEQAATSDYGQDIDIDYTNVDQHGAFKSNTALMDFSNAAVTTVDGVVTLTFPWVSGYVDYQGDEDWYTIDLGMPYVATDDAWYYDISFELRADGSDVEYSWQYYPNSNNDGAVSIRRCAGTTYYCNGIQAFGADQTLDADSVVLNTFGDDANFLWYGSGDQVSWRTCVAADAENNCTQYTGLVHFRIADFNYFFTDTDTVNPEPDADWGYDAPYFFRVVLTYHGGASHPPAAGLLP